MGDKTGAGDAEPNLADDLGDKTGAGGAKPNIADDEGVVLMSPLFTQPMKPRHTS